MPAGASRVVPLPPGQLECHRGDPTGAGAVVRNDLQDVAAPSEAVAAEAARDHEAIGSSWVCSFEAAGVDEQEARAQRSQPFLDFPAGKAMISFQLGKEP